MKNILKWLLIGLVVVFIGLQLIPYGRDHSSHPVTGEPEWDSTQTRELAARTCFDCHSNETIWPWYSNVAPVSWLIQRDVTEGRSRLNFSEWDSARFDEPWEIVEVLAEGEMPPAYYLPLHSKAQLTPEEKQALVQGFQATFGR